VARIRGSAAPTLDDFQNLEPAEVEPLPA